jgi:hypothetical protein
MRIARLWFSVLMPYFTGCAVTSVAMLDEDMRYLPSANVEILSAPPTKAYKAIAILETAGPANASLPDLLESMRQKAKGIGTDAVIPTGDANQRPPQGLIYNLYNPWLGGYQTFGGGVLPKIRGLAIKYQ